MNIDLMLPGIFAFSIIIVIGKPVIRLLQRLKFGQSIRSDGPQAHLKKAGTPTMGGIMILFAITAVGLAMVGEDQVSQWVLLSTLGFGAIGLLDDFLIIVYKRPLGLKARYKLLFQILLALLIGLAAFTIKGTAIYLPFIGPWEMPIWAYLPWTAFFIVGFSNAVNLTDGLDALAAGVSTISALALTALAVSTGFLGLAVLCSAVAGACLGFVWFNAPPAQVFMGDTGALALGAFLGTVAVFTGTEFYYLIIGGIFVLETLSDIIQVASFRLRGKRVFRMAPLHHHYELNGLAETKVVARFWLLSLLFAFLGLYLFYRV